MRNRRGGYSGNADFEFEIERFKDRETGELLREDQLIYPDDDNFEFETVYITLNVRGNAYYQPGIYYGPPENCYPDEGDCELSSVEDEDGNDWEDRLTKSELDSIMEKISECASEEDDYDPPDDYDRDYDDARADYVYDPYHD
jgi:hypothetical protein